MNFVNGEVEVSGSLKLRFGGTDRVTKCIFEVEGSTSRLLRSKSWQKTGAELIADATCGMFLSIRRVGLYQHRIIYLDINYIIIYTDIEGGPHTSSTPNTSTKLS